jgi:hypothetical protein
MGGVNVGHWKQTRATLQLEMAGTRRNFPLRFFTDSGVNLVNYHTALVLQVGAAF